MAYIGNIPAESYASFETETFSVSATANYTLSHAVTNENEIRLVINGVVQQPGSGKAYTASGTTLTLTSATVSGDVMYAVYLGRALQTVNPPNASVGTAQLADSSVTSAKLGTKNTPAFLANYTAAQAIANATATKVQFNSELFDSDNNYDNSSNYRFTPTTAGKYVVGLKLKYNNSQSCRLYTMIYKNGSEYERSEKWSDGSGTDLDPLSVTIINFNGSSDYVEAFALQESGGSLNLNNATTTRAYFYAYKIIE